MVKQDLNNLPKIEDFTSNRDERPELVRQRKKFSEANEKLYQKSFSSHKGNRARTKRENKDFLKELKFMKKKRRKDRVKRKRKTKTAKKHIKEGMLYILETKIGRFVIVLNDRVIDDANGYGFKSLNNAMKSNTWKYPTIKVKKAKGIFTKVVH